MSRQVMQVRFNYSIFLRRISHNERHDS